MKKTIKDKVLYRLKRMAARCKPLTYPAVVVMVVFLSIYHAIKALFQRRNIIKCEIVRQVV